MTRDNILQRLQANKDKGTRALLLLEAKPVPVEAREEIQSLAQWIKEELQRDMTACCLSECNEQ